MRVVNGAAMVWFLIKSWIIETAGRSTKATQPIHSSVHLCSEMKFSGDVEARIRSTRLPTKAISATSMIEPMNPTTSRTRKTGQIGCTKCQ